jgi:hypothetical protein
MPGTRQEWGTAKGGKSPPDSSQSNRPELGESQGRGKLQILSSGEPDAWQSDGPQGPLNCWTLSQSGGGLEKLIGIHGLLDKIAKLLKIIFKFELKFSSNKTKLSKLVKLISD